MESKLFVLVLFGTAVQITFAYDHDDSAGSSDVKSIACILQRSERTVSKAFNTVLNAIFDELNYVAQVNLGSAKEVADPVARNEYFKTKAMRAWMRALTTTVIAIQVIAPNPPANFTSDLSSEEAQLSELQDCIIRAIALSRKYAGTVAEIEELGEQATAIIIDIYKTLYNALKNGRSKHDTVIIKAINYVETKILQNVRVMFNTIFNGVKILFDIHASKFELQAEDILNTIKLLRQLALSFAEDDVIHEYQLFLILAASDSEDSPKIASHFNAIQSADKKTIEGWNSTMLEPIVDLLATIYQCEDVKYATESIEDQVVENARSAYLSAVDAIENLRTENSPEIVIDGSALQREIREAIEIILNSIVLATDKNHSKNLDEIRANGEVVISGSMDLVSGLFTNIARITIDRLDLRLEIEIIRESTLDNFRKAFEAIFEAIEIIADNELSDEEFVNQRLPLVIARTKLVLLYRLHNDVAFKLALVRGLNIRNSLYESGIALDYCVDIA